MRKPLFFVLIVVFFCLLIGGIWWLSSSKNKTNPNLFYHSDLYLQAQDVWDPILTVGSFHPQDIAEETIGSSSYIRVTWQKPEQTYNHFLLTISQPESGWSRKESGEHDRVSLDLSGLEPNTEYVIALQACLNPRCEAWLIGTSEGRGKTAMMYWRVDETLTQEFLTEEKWDEGRLPEKENMVFLNGENLSFTSEEQSSFSLESLWISKREPTDQRLVFKKADGSEAMAILINP